MGMKLTWVKMSGYRAFGEKSLPYVIQGSPYGSKKSWQLFVNGERVPLAFSSRLRDIKEKAQVMEDAS